MTMNVEQLQRQLEQERQQYLANLPVDDQGQRRCPECDSVVGEGYCEACAERRREAEARKQSISQLQSRFRRCAGWTDHHVGTAGVLPQWRWARLSNDRFRSLVSPALLAAVEGWEPAAGNLCLLAPTGAGKSSLLVAWLWREYRRRVDAIEAGEAPPTLPDFAFISAPDLVSGRRGHPLGQGDAPLLVRAKTVGLLLLDELGFEANADQLVLELADTRYRSQLTTVLTTGLQVSEFTGRYGAACWRRFSEGGVVVTAFRKERTR